MQANMRVFPKKIKIKTGLTGLVLSYDEQS